MAKEQYSRTRALSEQEAPRVWERHWINPSTTEAQKELSFGAATGMLHMFTVNTAHRNSALMTRCYCVRLCCTETGTRLLPIQG